MKHTILKKIIFCIVAIIFFTNLAIAAEKVMIVMGTRLEEEKQQSLQGSILSAIKGVLHTENIELKFYYLNSETKNTPKNDEAVTTIKQYHPDALVLVHDTTIKDVGLMTDNVPIAFTWLFGDEIDQGLLCRL